MSIPMQPDTRPLTEPVRGADVRAWRKRVGSGSLATVLFLAVAIGAGAVFVFVFVSLLGSVGSMIAADASGGVLFLVFVLVVGALAVLVGGWLVRSWLTPTRQYRLARFAEANGLEYRSLEHDPTMPGMIFAQGHDRVATDRLRGSFGRRVEFGNYRYETGTDKQRRTHRWGYIAIKLDVPLPNIVLDARSNNTLLGSNLPESFGRHQRLGLEGDFDKYFTLFVPQGYERDALYLFTPDIMARFIDRAAALDVEIVDDWLFLYTQGDITTLDPAQWRWQFSVVGAILDKLAQWGRWRDERLAAAGMTPDAGSSSGPDAAASGITYPTLAPPRAVGVAAGGRRLRRSAPVAVVVAMVVVILAWIAAQSGVFGALFGAPN